MLMHSTLGSRGGSLMNRVASPIMGTEKGNKGETGGFNLAATMAGTANMTGTSQMSMPSQASARGGHGTSIFTHHSSPFRQTITRTMMTGVGFLGKPK